MTTFSNNTYSLTAAEENFISKFLADNGCGAKTPSDLIEENFSCQCIQDLNELFTGELNSHQIAGFISSLEKKCVITIEDRSKDGLPFEILPDLYWVEEDYLKSLDLNLNFGNLK